MLLKRKIVIYKNKSLTYNQKSINRCVFKLYNSTTTNDQRKPTTIIVAHRLSVIQAADIIMVLNDGKLVEQGTHDELMTNSGRYVDLIRQLQHVS